MCLANMASGASPDSKVEENTVALLHRQNSNSVHVAEAFLSSSALLLIPTAHD
jgi:hypothetical protein